MINFLKNMWFTLRFNKAEAILSESCGEIKELNGVYYAVLTNGLVYDIKHFNKFFNVRVFYNGTCISIFKYGTDAKLLTKKEKSLTNGEAILNKLNIKTTLLQILCDCPFTRCKPEDFLQLAQSMNSKFTSDDYLSFFFKRDYPTIGMVEYKLSIKHYTGSGSPSYSSQAILLMDGLFYEPVYNNQLTLMSSNNLNFVEKYSTFVSPFFMRYAEDLYLVYFDLKCVHIVHFVDKYTIEKKSINYRNSQQTIVTEQVAIENIHYYFESIMYDLVKMKASQEFFERCEQCSIEIEDPLAISNAEMELFKMAIY